MTTTFNCCRATPERRYGIMIPYHRHMLSRSPKRPHQRPCARPNRLAKSVYAGSTSSREATLLSGSEPEGTRAATFGLLSILLIFLLRTRTSRRPVDNKGLSTQKSGPGQALDGPGANGFRITSCHKRDRAPNEESALASNVTGCPHPGQLLDLRWMMIKFASNRTVDSDGNQLQCPSQHSFWARSLAVSEHFVSYCPHFPNGGG
jgi:hypothetical protein